MYLTVQGKSISGDVILRVKVNRDWQRFVRRSYSNSNRGKYDWRTIISSGDAVSKNNSNASRRFFLASSTVSPWLATSTSGHKETYPSPSLSMIAVSCLFITYLLKYDIKKTRTNTRKIEIIKYCVSRISIID